MECFKKQLKGLLITISIATVGTIIVGLLLGFYHYTFFAGAIIGGLLSCGNQFLFAFTISAIFDKQSKKVGFLRASYAMRYFAMFSIIGLCAWFFSFNIFAMVIPIFAPKIYYYIAAFATKN